MSRASVLRPLVEVITPESALIFRITHISNVPWILANGLHCASSGQLDPSFTPIGNPDLIARRADRPVPVPPGGSLSDYIPFYFTPRTPMLYNVTTGRGLPRATPPAEIAILVASARDLEQAGHTVIVTDRHAVLRNASFTVGLGKLGDLDWERLRTTDFRRRPDEPDRFERYQAEALVHGKLEAHDLRGIVCYGPGEAKVVTEALARGRLSIEVGAQPAWYCQ